MSRLPNAVPGELAGRGEPVLHHGAPGPGPRRRRRTGRTAPSAGHRAGACPCRRRRRPLEPPSSAIPTTAVSPPINDQAQRTPSVTAQPVARRRAPPPPARRPPGGVAAPRPTARHGGPSLTTQVAMHDRDLETDVHQPSREILGHRHGPGACRPCSRSRSWRSASPRAGSRRSPGRYSGGRGCRGTRRLRPAPRLVVVDLGASPARGARWRSGIQ